MTAEYVPTTFRYHSARELTDRKISELKQLADLWQGARARYIEQYWASRHLYLTMRAWRHLAESRRHAGWVEPRLGAHYNKLALESALKLVKQSWLGAMRGTSAVISCRTDLTEAERHWLRYVIRWPLLVQACVQRRHVQVAQDWAIGIDERRLSRWLGRTVRRSRSRPHPGSEPWFEVDTNLYRTFTRSSPAFKGPWIAISGLVRRKRICVPLASAAMQHLTPRTRAANSLPGLRVRIGDRVTFEVVVRRPVEPRSGPEAGLDIGYRNLLTAAMADSGEVLQFGTNSRERIDAITEGSKERRRQKQRLAAYERSLRNTNPAKARRIQRSCLGTAKARRHSSRERGALREDIDRSLNLLFQDQRNVARIHFEDLSFPNPIWRRPSFRRRLSRWLRGYLQRRLTYKAELNGVELNAVNPAFTSQTCPRCGYLSGSNRRADWFQCRLCAHSGHADAIAAINVLRRGSDPAITRFTPPRRVKQILEARWRSALHGSAWGSNADDPHTDELGGPVVSASRESLPLAPLDSAGSGGPYSPL